MPAQREGSALSWHGLGLQRVFVERLERVSGWIDEYRHAESSGGKK